ncbi:hypothetical protein SESBI_20793 [Sesbania bispinosa]|nr:hypothetical protein SESBI_20793 [Sesbania bispinosa]
MAVQIKSNISRFSGFVWHEYDNELPFGNYQPDEQAWIDTIKSVGSRLGQSQFIVI